jgi:hypothetical protein
MSITPEKRLYDYTRAFAAGVTSSENLLHSFLKNLYLEAQNKDQVFPPLVYNGDYPLRFAQAYDDYLDLIGRGFGIVRGPNETDEAFRQKIKLVIIQNPTITGIENAVKTLFSGLGFSVLVEVLPAVSNFFDGVNSTLETPIRGKLGSRSFRVDIRIRPNFRIEYPNFVYKIAHNNNFQIEDSARYLFYLNPFLLNQEDVGEVFLYLKNLQFTNIQRQLVYSAISPRANTIVDLGFLTSVQELNFEVLNKDGLPLDSLTSYFGYLTVNESGFDFYRNPEYNTLLLNFGVRFLREIFSEVSSFGINIERITVKNAGTGG